jgi:hypothetical protein
MYPEILYTNYFYSFFFPIIKIWHDSLNVTCYRSIAAFTDLVAKLHVDGARLQTSVYGTISTCVVNIFYCNADTKIETLNS